MCQQHESGEKMGVNCQGTQKNIGGPVPARRELDKLKEVQAGENAKKHGQRIAASLLGIMQVIAVNAKQGCCCESDSRIEQAAAQQVKCGDGSDAENNR